MDIVVPDAAFVRELAQRTIEMGWSIAVPRAGFVHLHRRDLAGLPPALFGYGG